MPSTTIGPATARVVATIVPPILPAPSATLAGPLAWVTAWLDMGSGSAAFDAMIHAQEVNTGETIRAFLSVGDHHAEAVSRKEPIQFAIRAPGTYVFYARLTYAPETYFWGYTGCAPLTDCDSIPLRALDVVPGANYELSITDRGVVLPEAGLPVQVPWQR
jgi:hypothetical protein